MDPIEILMAEHRRIERGLDSLEAFAGRAARGEAAPRADVARFARFFAEYADVRHHGKEEDILFSTMVDNGFPREAGPIAVMLHEHGIGRNCVATLRRLGEGAGELSSEERATLARTATEYAAMLRAHVLKEDRILYPMAEAHLAPEVFAAMAARFERFEGEHQGTPELLALAEELFAAYPPETPASSLELDTKGGHGHGDGGCGACGGH